MSPRLARAKTRELLAKQRAAKAARQNKKVDELEELDTSPDYAGQFALIMANFGAYTLDVLMKTPLCDIDILVEQAAHREAMSLWYRSLTGGF